MYIALCDDHKNELDEVISSVNKWIRTQNINVNLRSFSCASELLDAIEKESFSLFILDIIMPGINGLDAARDIRSADKNADIIFLTSSMDFAYESYGVNATQYILKPINEEALFSLLDEIYLKEKQPYEGLIIKCNSSLTKVLFANISFVEVQGKHIYFNLSDSTVKEASGPLKEYEPMLLKRREFIQVHRSFIVNMYHIKELTAHSITTFSNKTIPVSRKMYPALYKAYIDLLFD